MMRTLLLFSILLCVSSMNVQAESFGEPFAPDSEMISWARQSVPRKLSHERWLRRLVDSLLSPHGLNLQEITHPTLTARQAFHQGRANCVSFASLFVGLAREEGVAVYFVLVGSPSVAEPRGDLAVSEGHLAAAWIEDGRLWVADFAGVTSPPVDSVRPVTDLTAMALFESNRGVEALMAEKEEDAVRHLERAVELDPSLIEAWTNLGVARRRLGDGRGARLAYEEALRLDPSTSAAYQNLAALLHRGGRPDEAAELLEESARLRRESALGFLRRARASFESGDLTASRGFYRKALELSHFGGGERR